MHYNWVWLTEFGRKGELWSEHPDQWRCSLSRAEVEPGVILLTNREYGANQTRKWKEVDLTNVYFRFRT
jgi:hypothetical protein